MAACSLHSNKIPRIHELAANAAAACHIRLHVDYTLAWKEPDVEGIVNFLVREKDFSEDRVRKSLEKMQQGASKQKGKTTLEKWFG